MERLQQRLATVRRRLDRAHLGRLYGKISEEFLQGKASERQQEQQQILLAIQELEWARPEWILNGVRILELANKAHFLCVRQSPTEKAKLLRMVLSNCAVDAVSVHPTYRKPFSTTLAASLRLLRRCY